MSTIHQVKYLDEIGHSPFSRWLDGIETEAAARITEQTQPPSRSPMNGGWSDGNASRQRRGSRMALTRDFKETIQARARKDPRFRDALFTEALNAYLAGDTAAGKAMLRDLVNATIGFEGLAAEVRKPSKSLHRMLAPQGNPSTENFFSIVSALQKRTRVRLNVTAKSA